MPGPTGSIVAMEPQTGRVRVMVSVPEYDETAQTVTEESESDDAAARWIGRGAARELTGAVVARALAKRA